MGVYYHLSSKDNTADFRKFGLDCAADLLEAKPEQEAALLTMCVNKLGDPDRKVGPPSLKDDRRDRETACAARILCVP